MSRRNFRAVRQQREWEIAPRLLVESPIYLGDDNITEIH